MKNAMNDCFCPPLTSLARCAARIFVAVMAVFLVAGCGSDKKEVREYVAIVGGDTLTAADVAELTGGDGLDSANIVRAVRQSSLSREVHDSADIYKIDRLSSEMAERLALRTDSKLAQRGSRSLLATAAALKKVLDTVRTSDSLSAYIDRILPRDSGIAASDREKQIAKVVSAAGSDSMPRLAEVVSALLGIEQAQAQLVAEYANSLSKQESDTALVAGLVKNLVYSPKGGDTAATIDVKQESKALAQPDNSELVLRFRDQKSIQDTIAGHSVNIQALYKKHLKTKAGLSGVVSVQFRLNPAGQVIGASVAQNQTGDTELASELVGYAKTMRFKAVPAKVGNMTFQFPFEFSPEN